MMNKAFNVKISDDRKTVEYEGDALTISSHSTESVVLLSFDNHNYRCDGVDLMATKEEIKQGITIETEFKNIFIFVSK